MISEHRQESWRHYCLTNFFNFISQIVDFTKGTFSIDTDLKRDFFLDPKEFLLIFSTFAPEKVRYGR